MSDSVYSNAATGRDWHICRDDEGDPFAREVLEELDPLTDQPWTLVPSGDAVRVGLFRRTQDDVMFVCLDADGVFELFEVVRDVEGGFELWRVGLEDVEQ